MEEPLWGGALLTEQNPAMPSNSDSKLSTRDDTKPPSVCPKPPRWTDMPKNICTWLGRSGSGQQCHLDVVITKPSKWCDYVLFQGKKSRIVLWTGSLLVLGNQQENTLKSHSFIFVKVGWSDTFSILPAHAKWQKHIYLRWVVSGWNSPWV